MGCFWFDPDAPASLPKGQVSKRFCWDRLFKRLDELSLSPFLNHWPPKISHDFLALTDVKDCQWIQRLHPYGLLQGSFRPEDPYCVLRSYMRYRDELVAARSRHASISRKPCNR
jgi:hypothetical protein